MPPRIWSDKDERMYAHVKEGELDRGRNTHRAEGIAAIRERQWQPSSEEVRVDIRRIGERFNFLPRLSPLDLIPA